MSKGKGQALGNIFGPGGRPPRAAAPPPPALPPTVRAFLATVDRVEAVLDAETAALAQGIPADVTEFGNRKRQGLLEMSRSLKAATAAGPRVDVRERLARFAVTLERNRAVLGSRLRAVREIADIIAQTLQEAESDGTYSALAVLPRAARQ